jgi:hypothetical protein
LALKRERPAASAIVADGMVKFLFDILIILKI